MAQQTLEDYLRTHLRLGVSDHSLRAHVHEGEVVGFYIHPTSCNGNTLDLLVTANTLHPAVVELPDGTYQLRYTLPPREEPTTGEGS